MRPVGKDYPVTDASRPCPTDGTPRIPVLRPAMPTACQLRPWLERIDASGVYSNHGPLCRRFSADLAALYGPEAGIVPVSSGTMGLVLALLAQGAAPGTLCMLPSWTFAATGHAARAAGLEPWLVDVDAGSGMLTPDAAEALLAAAPGPVGAVMPVVPFGQPFPYAAWEAFAARTRLPVVIDAAAAFDTMTVTAVPTVVSLHATKLFGVGEGGFVASTRVDVLESVLRAGNFGFFGSRVATVPAVNGKMSEIHAAVGLAALETWPVRRAAYSAVCGALAAALGGLEARLQPGWGESWLSSTCIVRLPACGATADAELAARGIETRRWWGEGLHSQPAFAGCRRTALPATEALARTVIGLPCHLGLTMADVAHIRDSLAEVIAGMHAAA